MLVLTEMGLKMENMLLDQNGATGDLIGPAKWLKGCSYAGSWCDSAEPECGEAHFELVLPQMF